jgi:hypothetical protein
MLIYAVQDNDEEIPVTFRFKRGLLKEIEAIAKRERRSRSKTIAMLLERGITSYRKDGILLVPPDYSYYSEPSIPKFQIIAKELNLPENVVFDIILALENELPLDKHPAHLVELVKRALINGDSEPLAAQG